MKPFRLIECRCRLGPGIRRHMLWGRVRSHLVAQVFHEAQQHRSLSHQRIPKQADAELVQAPTGETVPKPGGRGEGNGTSGECRSSGRRTRGAATLTEANTGARIRSSLASKAARPPSERPEVARGCVELAFVQVNGLPARRPGALGLEQPSHRAEIGFLLGHAWVTG